jgi:hypothetical protein
MREKILTEIRRIAQQNGGKSPGVRAFEHETGITEGSWRGVYWARWGDAVTEAGCVPNAKQEKFDEGFFLTKLADACEHFGKFPTAMELRMYQKNDLNFPNVKSITRHFGSLKNIPPRLAEWAGSQPGRSALSVTLAVHTESEQTVSTAAVKEGIVYLIKSGAHYKIGRSDELERRVKEIRIALPEAATLIHSIRTDDPPGIEAYWHRRFADKRANGEWFKLTNSDVGAFKRRKFQ